MRGPWHVTSRMRTIVVFICAACTACAAQQPSEAAVTRWHLSNLDVSQAAAPVTHRFSAAGFKYRGRVALATSVMQDRRSTPSSNRALRATTAAAAAAAGKDVTLIRIDSAGHVYTRTIVYNASRFQQLAYPPSDPQNKAGAAMVNKMGAPAAAVASAASTAATAAVAKGHKTPAAVAAPQPSGLPCTTQQSASAGQPGKPASTSAPASAVGKQHQSVPASLSANSSKQQHVIAGGPAAAGASAQGRRLTAHLQHQQQQQDGVAGMTARQQHRFWKPSSSSWLLRLCSWALRQSGALGSFWTAPHQSRRTGASIATTTSSTSTSSSTSSVPQRRLLTGQTVFSPDNRLPCPAKTFPYTALGEIIAPLDGITLVCTGGLVGPDTVLTAGHCVFNDRAAMGRRSIFHNLTFSPAGLAGKAVAWEHVTLFADYIEDPFFGRGLQLDLAVIKLRQAVGKQLGWLGIRASGSGSGSDCTVSAPLVLNLAGYPGSVAVKAKPVVAQGTVVSALQQKHYDKHANLNVSSGCLHTQCSVNASCTSSATLLHTCDSSTGQSGAPMFDADGYVRAVHYMGVVEGLSTQNSAVTVSKFILDALMGYAAESTAKAFTLTKADGLDYGDDDDDG